MEDRAGGVSVTATLAHSAEFGGMQRGVNPVTKGQQFWHFGQGKGREGERVEIRQSRAGRKSEANGESGIRSQKCDIGWLHNFANG